MELNFLEVIEYTSTSHDSWFCTNCGEVDLVVKIFQHEQRVDSTQQEKC